MTIAKMIACMTCIVGLAITGAGCATDADPADSTETTTASAASSICRQVKHFRYSHDGLTFQWEVTTEIGTGRQFVDEFRPGYHRQYTVSPVWSTCPCPNDTVRLRSGSIVLVGVHNCYIEENGEAREEYHGSDYQRLLIPQVPFITQNCDP